jgi:hypothetical protein
VLKESNYQLWKAVVFSIVTRAAWSCIYFMHVSMKSDGMESQGIWKCFQLIWVLLDIQIILHVFIYVPDYKPGFYITFLHYLCYWVGHICTFLSFPFTSYFTTSREQDCAPILDAVEGRLLSDVHWSIVHILGLTVYTLAVQMFLPSWIKKKNKTE